MSTVTPQPYQIDVQVRPEFIPNQSDPEENRYVFAYTVTLKNTGEIPAQLISRHWIITNGEGKREEVKGAGVVGETPHLSPGQLYEYTSGSILKTPVGSMVGSYQMKADDGTYFEASIPMFTLSAINLH